MSKSLICHKFSWKHNNINLKKITENLFWKNVLVYDKSPLSIITITLRKLCRLTNKRGVSEDAMFNRFEMHKSYICHIFACCLYLKIYSKFIRTCMIQFLCASFDFLHCRRRHFQTISVCQYQHYSCAVPDTTIM